MSTPSQGLEIGVRIIRNVIDGIESNVIESGTSSLGDKKTISIAARLVELLDKLAYLLENLARKIEASRGDALILSSYTYLFKTGNEVIFVRTRPEYIAISCNPDSKTISFKVRSNKLILSPNSLEVSARRVSFKIHSFNREEFRDKRDRLRSILGVFEKALYRRLLPYVEQSILKK